MSPEIQGLDPVIHAQARLRVVVTLAALAPGERLAFTRLQRLLGMTAGNLTTHLRKLEEARYVRVEKTRAGRAPVTHLELTSHGRAAFEDYTRALRGLLDATPDPTSPDANRTVHHRTEEVS